MSTTEKDCGPDLVPAKGLNLLCQSSTASTTGRFITDITNDGNSRTVYHNNLNRGLKYMNSAGVIKKTYTVQFYLKVVNFNKSYTRIIDLSGGTEDNGLYFTNHQLSPPTSQRCLNFFPNGNFGTCPFFNNYTYYLLTIARNDTTKKVDIYVNDKLFTTYDDTQDFYTGAAGRPVYIFRDDPVGFACEDGEANFAYLSFSNYFTTESEVIRSYQDISITANAADFSFEPKPVCIKQNSTITYQGNIPDTAQTFNFLWDWDGGKVISGSARGPYVVNWSSPGTKNITLSVTGGVCLQQKIVNTKQITLNTIPVPSLAANADLCMDDSMVLSPGIFDNYLWQDGSVQSSYTVTTAGYYHVKVYNSCSENSASINVRQISCDIFFPSGFTPNQDALNETFKTFYKGNFQTYHLCIYNRFGQLIFETRDANTAWDGTVKGIPVSVGTYVWFCQYRKTAAQPTRLIKGFVVLMR